MADKTAPKCQLRLEWVYGYRGHQCRNNLYYTSHKEIVYFVAGVGVVYNIHDHKQRFFLGHDDDIVSLAIHPDLQLVATGQIGKDPYICVWDSASLQTVSFLRNGHTHGISAVNFDGAGNLLVSVGMDSNATINVWDWKKGKILSTTRGHNDKVLDCQFDPYQESSIVSCGVKHIKFWTLCGNTLSSKKGIFGKVGDIQTVTCLSFAPNSVTYSGTLSGCIYIWNGNNLTDTVPAHKGPVYSIYKSLDGYVSGGKDGVVRLWDLELSPITSIDIASSSQGYPGLCIRSVCWSGEKVVVGTQRSDVIEVNPRNRANPVVHIRGHAEGELWALAVHPSKPIFVTGSDDQTLRIWNIQDKTLKQKASLPERIRSCALDADGSHVAVGLSDGSFVVFKTKDMTEVTRCKDRKEVIHEMKYSPDGQLLAVGSNDNFVDVYSPQQRYKKVGTCSGSSSFITHLDWSEDSQYIQTNSGAAERLVYKATGGKRVTSKDEINGIRWKTWTCVLGNEVNGIWAKYTDTNDINAVDAAFNHECAVTGDDFGLVKLFRFPSVKAGAKFRKYVGHSSHVTNIRFTYDKSRVISTGGADHAIFQWRFIPDGQASELDDNQEYNVCVDSNSEASDSDLSDVAELDSDLETEKQISYERKLDASDLKILQSDIKDELKAGKKRKEAPADSLKLEFVHGYRAYDCRNNLFYTQQAEIVYHVAAVGIVYSPKTHKQRFYLHHTDDILCLACHPLKDYVSTGQVGKDPDIHVWDVDSLKTLSILKGAHQRGVCAVDFSADGKRLASIGLDDNHSIQVWEWRKGEKLANARGHNDKIFVFKWSPHEPNQAITVGVKHIKFWTQAGGGFTSQRGTFGSVAKLDTMLSVTYGRSPQYAYSGGSSGAVYVWKGRTLERVVEVHKGPCFALHSLEKGFVTGGKDGIVCLYDESFDRCLKSFPLKRSALTSDSRGTLVSDLPAIRSCILGHGFILIGTKNGEILQLDKSGPVTLLVQGHQQGEIWGLANHPSKTRVCTVSDDKTVRVWDISDSHRMITCRVMKKAGRCCCYSPDGKAIAVGLNDGSFQVIDAETLEDIVAFSHRKEEISDIRFSPGVGKYLAVASHDNFVDLYNVQTSKRVGVCKGASSYITHVDWDKQGKLLQVNSGAKEQLFFEAPRGQRRALRNADIENINWDSWTCVLGHTCEGIWPPRCDVTDVNTASVSRDKQLIATGDDFGFVKLYNYPSKGKFAKHKKYSGHSAHVTNVRWSSEGSRLVSVGGADTSIMVWTRETSNSKKPGVVSPSNDDDSLTESEGEGYDSEIQRELSIDYTTKIYSKPLRETEGVKPQDQPQTDTNHKPAISRVPEQKVKTQVKNSRDINNLQLHHVHGYRGADSRNNLHFINDGADIVYHAAATAIVMGVSKGEQRFYLEHTDDILCLTVNQHPKYKQMVATGQVGATPVINVWDCSSLKTVSTIKGFHTKAVSFLDFSSSGRLLVSVGLDSENSVAAWRWQEGSLVASSPGGSTRIFQAAFRPDSDSQFVTVGVNHVKFWNIVGNQLMCKRGKLQSENVTEPIKQQTMLSVAFGLEGVTYTGSMSGDVFVWKDSSLSRLVSKAHDGPVFSLYTTLKDGLIVSGAKEKRALKDGGCVKLWDQEMKRCRAYQIDMDTDMDVVKSVCRQKGSLLVGTKDSNIILISEKSGQGQVLVQGHSEGEIWGLAVHPTQNQFATASDDGTVKLWDLQTKGLLRSLPIGAARSVAFNNNGELLAIGLKSGEVIVATLTNMKVWAKRRDRGSCINDIKFSPDGKVLAVGCEESCVDLYDSTSQSLPKLTTCKGVLSFVIQMDFSANSSYLRVSTGAYQHVVFNVSTGEPVSDQKVLSDRTWATWTSMLGDEVVGIWPRDSNSGDINCAHLSNSGKALATGDDLGFVKLFEFPVSTKHAVGKRYIGHSAHVTNTRFSHSDHYLISTGGDDSCVFVWKTTA